MSSRRTHKNGGNTLSEALYLTRSLYITAKSEKAGQQHSYKGLTLRRATREASILACNTNNFFDVHHTAVRKSTGKLPG